MVLTAFVGAKGIQANWDQAVLPLVLLVRGLGLDMLGLTRLFAALQEMHVMRKELARLKVQEERERLSRDLHDLLGHTLSLITLKSELARHLITENPVRSAQELFEMEGVARQTLREVREAVAGYRQPQLEGELEGARQLLAAAGINYQIEPMKNSLPSVVDAVLACIVREGVTNVIRHSRARQCYIRLIQRDGIVVAEVVNDGGAGGARESTTRRGLGLIGLQERVNVLGGSMEVGPFSEAGKECFRLYVELPIQDEMIESRLQEAQR
jgi:two-component system sensor histidine kinase DesK